MNTVNLKTQKTHQKKYAGRPEMLKKKIQLLDCLWNDVVQLLPLHPKKVFEQQKQFGLIPDVPPYKFYQIDPAQLDPKKTVIYFKTAAGEENSYTRWLSEVNLGTIQGLPPATIEYYRSLIGSGELPFNYQFIPHVMHQGKIDVSGAEIITL